MRKAVKTVHPSKREVIVIDDSDEESSEQPIVKSGKREGESVPSPVVVELQKKLLESEENFQRSCREASENRLDTDRGFKYGFLTEKKRADDLEKRLAEVTTELEEARRNGCLSAANLMLENEALKTKMAEMKEEHEERVLDMIDLRIGERQQVHASQTADRVRFEDMKRKMMEQERQMKSDRESVYLMTVQRGAERAQAHEGQARDRARIEELTQKLAQYESEQQVQLPQLPAANPGEDASVSVRAGGVWGFKLLDADHPTNILNPCLPESNDSVSLAHARNAIFPILAKVGGTSLHKKVLKCFEPLQEWIAVGLPCTACGEIYKHYEIIYHFFSNEHIEKVSTLGAAVSRAALDYWLDKLQAQQHPAAAVHPLQQSAGATASWSTAWSAE